MTAEQPRRELSEKGKDPFAALASKFRRPRARALKRTMKLLRQKLGREWYEISPGPDVTAVEVAKLEWLPVTEVTVSTYEIKPARAAQDVENVYEAAAHGKQAHRANLVIEQPAESAPVSDEVKATARNFG